MLNAQKYNTSVIFFYGIDDGWSPILFANNMKERVDKINSNSGKVLHRVLIDDDAFFEHAFVVRGSKEMAIKLCSIIYE